MNKETIFRSALNTIHYSGFGRLAGPVFKGQGAYLMLHHILPGGGLQQGFAPNAGLEITPEFLTHDLGLNDWFGSLFQRVIERFLTVERQLDKPTI